MSTEIGIYKAIFNELHIAKYWTRSDLAMCVFPGLYTYVFSCGVDLKFNDKAVVFYHNIQTIIVAMGISSHIRHYFNSNIYELVNLWMTFHPNNLSSIFQYTENYESPGFSRSCDQIVCCLQQHSLITNSGGRPRELTKAWTFFLFLFILCVCGGERSLLLNNIIHHTNDLRVILLLTLGFLFRNMASDSGIVSHIG